MSSQPGTQEQPLRIAIIGSGPAGFYAAERLFKENDLVVQIDMFDRLPTPFGLVRGGVAPDHPKIKSVVKVYDRIAKHDGFRFFGHVEFGSDITHDDIVQHYHAVIYAVGSQTDKQMGIPGEDLPGSHAATEFVGWYNGHPDYRHYEFDLTKKRAAVIGNGNVAMDVARILARSYDELRTTDIADYALDALAKSNIEEIYILGRRGPAQAAYTNPEIKELGEMEIADIIVSPEDAALDPLTQQWLKEHNTDRTVERNVEIVQEYAQRKPSGKPKRIIMRYLVSPVEIIGTERVEAIKLVKNELYMREDGTLRPRPTDEFEILPVDLVFRSIGYRGVPLPGVPFREDWGLIPNDAGRVLTAPGGEHVIGEYVVGWIKRGPSGVIGTNKPDSVETVEHLLEDARAGQLLSPSAPDADAIVRLLDGRNIRYITYADWEMLDAEEQKRGEPHGRPRVKFTDVKAMLDFVAQHREQKLNPTGD
ncbi:MAG: NADP oxidoreductase [Chloroflexi bacterium]|nr:MAG: NADP oxidoreductase [Chloroflexota bacterium]